MEMKKMSNVYKKQVGGTHYQSMTIQPSEFINKNNLPFAEGNAIKYLCRHKQKGQKQDLEKAIHYCQMAIDRDYTETELKKVILSSDWGAGSLRSYNSGIIRLEDEEIRVCYVGVSRAEEELYIFNSTYKNTFPLLSQEALRGVL